MVKKKKPKTNKNGPFSGGNRTCQNSKIFAGLVLWRPLVDFCFLNVLFVYHLNFLIFIIIFQFVVNELFSQLSALVSLNLSRGSVLVSLNLPGQKCHGALPRVIGHPVHAEQPTVPCGITLTQTNWKISPLSEQNA